MQKIFVFICFVILITGSSIFAQEEKYELVKVSFEGNKNIPNSELADVISSQETPFWLLKLLNKVYSKIGKEPSYFDSTKIKDDLKSLENYYNDNGFFKCNFKASYKVDQEKKQAELTFYVKEGVPFKISSFKVTGLELLSKRVGTEASVIIDKIDTGEVYKKANIETARQSLLTLFLDRGFFFANTAQRDVFIDTTANKVGVILGFDTGKRYRLSEIRVKKSGPGSEFVKDTLIKKIAGLQTGAYYGFGETRTAQIRLVRTNLFSSVLVNPVVQDTVSNRFPMEINAEIGKLHELSPELVVNEQEGALNLGLGGNYLKKNFLGDARSLTVRASSVVQDIFRVNYSHITRFLAPNDTTIKGYLDGRIIMSQPFLFNKRILFTTEVYSTINKLKQYRSIIYGGRLSFDFELPKIVYLNFLQAYYYVESSEDQFSIDYLREFFKSKGLPSQRIDSLLNVLKPSYTRISSVIGTEFGANKTNNLLFPTRGYRLSITFEEANSLPFLLSKIGLKSFAPETQFYRSIFDFAVFPGIYENNENAFGIKLKIGHVKAYRGSDINLPLNKRFTAGGSNSVRGWRSRDLIPNPGSENIDYSHLGGDVLKSSEQIAVGGTFLLEGSFETRNRLIGNLGTAFFLDYGNTWNANNVNFKNIAVAVGFGIRYYSSFAPVRIDFGFKGYDPSTKKNIVNIMKHNPFWTKTFVIQIGLGEAF